MVKKYKRYFTVFESRRVLFLSSNPEFYLQRIRLQVVLNMDAHSNPRRTLKSVEWQLKPLRREKEDYSTKVPMNAKEWQLNLLRREKEDCSG